MVHVLRCLRWERSGLKMSVNGEEMFAFPKTTGLPEGGDNHPWQVHCLHLLKASPEQG